jgi:hypothetical protein
VTAYQVWRDEKGIDYIPSCVSCGEHMRSSPAYDGGGPSCMRRACRKERGAVVEAACKCSWTKHHTGEECPYAKRAAKLAATETEKK